MKPIVIWVAIATVFAAPSSPWHQRIEDLEVIQAAHSAKLLAAMEIIEQQQVALDALCGCYPECCPIENWDGDPLPVPPDEEYD